MLIGLISKDITRGQLTKDGLRRLVDGGTAATRLRINSRLMVVTL